MLIISDTSPIANLIQIGRLDLLNLLFDKVTIPPAVHQEILALSQFSVSLEEYHHATWIRLVVPQDQSAVNELKTELDAGESEAIILAKELGSKLLLIDERLGTRVAHANGLMTLGLVGVIIRAQEKGFIPSAEVVFDELEAKAGFWMSQKLRERALLQLKKS